MWLVVDNYDSFTYNLVQYLLVLKMEVQVYANDQLSIKDIELMRPDRILISPGPGKPSDAGISMAVIERFAEEIPILGVCLGHQSIAEVFGGRVIKAERIMHGKVSNICHHGEALFNNIPSPFVATRYNSLLVDPETLPGDLQVTAWSEYNGSQEIMAMQHTRYAIAGVQFHPESVLSEYGYDLLKNFMYFY